MKYIPLLLLLTACGTYSHEQGLPGPTCLSVPEEMAETAHEALESWGPLPVQVDLEIGGTCGNRIVVQPHEQFIGRTKWALTEKWLTVDGARGDTEIVINPRRVSEHTSCRLRAILEHEIGHFLGLEAHTLDPHSVMQARPAWCKSTVTEADRADVAQLY